MYNAPFLLSPLQFLHNVFSKLRLLHLGAAEAEQVVTKDGSKNRSLAFSAAESGRSVLPALAFLSRPDCSTP